MDIRAYGYLTRTFNFAIARLALCSLHARLILHGHRSMKPPRVDVPMAEVLNVAASERRMRAIGFIMSVDIPQIDQPPQRALIAPGRVRCQ